MKKHWASLLALGLTLMAEQALGQQTAVRTAGASRLTGALLLIDQDYEGDTDYNLDGEMLSVAYKAAVNSQFSVGGGLGLLLDGDFGKGQQNGDGGGYRFFVEGDYAFLRSGANELQGTFGLQIDRFKFEQYFDEKLETTELKIGALFQHKIQQVALYAGMDVFLLSKGDISVGSFSDDIERNDRLGLRLGLAFAVDPRVDLRGEFDLIGQQTLLLATDIRF